VEQANAKADRERYYAQIREREQSRVDALLSTANKNAAFNEVSTAISQMELDIAKAEVRAPEKVDELQAKRKELIKERACILQKLGILESDLSVRYTCPKCKDSGYLKNGKPCSCYPHK
jgi:DNA replication protein DnaC